MKLSNYDQVKKLVIKRESTLSVIDHLKNGSPIKIEVLPLGRDLGARISTETVEGHLRDRITDGFYASLADINRRLADLGVEVFA